MINLSQASYDTKEILKWGGLFIAGLVVFIVLIRLVLIVKEAIFPTPPPKPTVLYGKLPAQLFPENVTKQKLTYSINTLSGSLPKFSGQAKVFRIKTVTPDLLGLSKTKDTVAKEDFTQGPNKISDTSYEWSNPKSADLASKITVNIINYDFKITSNYINNPSVISGDLPDQDKATADAKDALQSLNSLADDIDQANTQTALFSVKNASLTPATSLAEADVISVIFHQQDVDTLPIYYENPDSSNIQVFVGRGDKIVAANYIHQAVSDEFSTYPLKTPQTAFSDLEQGFTYIASYQGGSSEVSINDVKLAYYIGTDPQEFLMPIFIFEGKDNFVAYVPAVTDEWIEK